MKNATPPHPPAQASPPLSLSFSLFPLLAQSPLVFGLCQSESGLCQSESHHKKLFVMTKSTLHLLMLVTATMSSFSSFNNESRSGHSATGVVDVSFAESSPTRPQDYVPQR